jgi:hypothetical protein
LASSSPYSALLSYPSVDVDPILASPSSAHLLFPSVDVDPVVASSSLSVYHSPDLDDLDPFHSSFAQNEDLLRSIDLKTIIPNVKVYNFSGIDVPQKYLDILGLGFPFIPSSSSFSLNGALDTLHNLCHKLHKETIPPFDSIFKPSYSRVPILSFKDTKGCSTTPVFDSFTEYSAAEIRAERMHQLRAMGFVTTDLLLFENRDLRCCRCHYVAADFFAGAIRKTIIQI